MGSMLFGVLPYFKKSQEMKSLIEKTLKIAKERFKTDCYQDLNAAIHSVLMELGMECGKIMVENKEKGA
jgi:hypothetical protein